MADATLKDAEEKIAKIMSKKSGQFLLTGLDPALLSYCKSLVTKAGYEPITITNKKVESPENKIFFIMLNESNAILYQSLIYYYLEIHKKVNCFVCLISDNCRCLDFFEKRVRSRFENKIVFVPYLKASESIDKYLPSIGITKYPVQPFLGDRSLIIENRPNHPNISVQRRFNQFLINKYNLEPYTLAFHLDLFNPVHFALLLIMKKRRVRHIDSISIFREYTLDVNELKAVKSSEINSSYCDLVSSGFVNNTGDLTIDYSELKDYINLNCPQYIKKLIVRYSK